MLLAINQEKYRLDYLKNKIEPNVAAAREFGFQAEIY